MIATAVPGRLIRYARQRSFDSRPPTAWFPEILARLLQNPSGAAEGPHSSLQLV
jgi:hypothetical protein